jgi:hypothetical protein
MSLTDVDKNSDDRINPVPNAKDKLNNESMMSKNTLSTAQATPITGTTNSRIQILNNQILLTNSSNIATGLIGFDSSGNTVIKSSKTGFDARTATGDNLNFNSQQNTLKIVDVVNLTITGPNLATGSNTWAAATPTVVSQAHNLGYAPVPLAFLNDSGTFYPLEREAARVATGDPYWINWQIYTDTTNVYASINTMGYNINVTGETFSILVYLLQETAN